MKQPPPIFEFATFGDDAGANAVIGNRDFVTSGDYAVLQANAYQRAVAVWELLARRRAIPMLLPPLTWAIPLCNATGTHFRELDALWVAIGPQPFSGGFGRLLFAPARIGVDGRVRGRVPTLPVTPFVTAYGFAKPDMGPSLRFEFEAGREKGDKLPVVARRAYGGAERSPTAFVRGPARFKLVQWGDHNGVCVPPLAGRVGVTVRGAAGAETVSFSSPLDMADELRAQFVKRSADAAAAHS